MAPRPSLSARRRPRSRRHGLISIDASQFPLTKNRANARALIPIHANQFPLTKNRANARAFTLVELICVVAIIALLFNLVFPALDAARRKAKSVACASHLEQIGVAALAAVADNNNTYPKIEGDPSNPIYQPQDNALPLVTALAPYGIVTNSLRCPADTVGDDGPGQSFFSHRGTSYFWRPFLDDEVNGTTVIYARNQVIPVSSAKICIVTDFSTFHSGRSNRLYGDGHVKYYSK